MMQAIKALFNVLSAIITISYKVAELERKQIEPVFVVGANRSGTSLITYILSQHPKLEGLFKTNKISIDDVGHIRGYCESGHIWTFLKVAYRKRKKNKQLPLWSLPNYLSTIYKNKVSGKFQCYLLVAAILKYRKTNKIPLIKDNYNTLRVGLIKQVFPKARFVFIYRESCNYITNGLHKWTYDKSGAPFNYSEPRIGLHWYLVNTIALYDLETYAKNDYAVIKLEDINNDESICYKALDNLLHGIRLEQYYFDLSEIRFNKGKQVDGIDMDPEKIIDLVNMEAKSASAI